MERVGTDGNYDVEIPRRLNLTQGHHRKSESMMQTAEPRGNIFKSNGFMHKSENFILDPRLPEIKCKMNGFYRSRETNP